MTREEFAAFTHDAYLSLVELNRHCWRSFRLGDWPRYDYDLAQGTITFSKDGVAKVIAATQAVGTTSAESNTWLWAWANSSIPATAVEGLARVRKFGESEGLPELTVDTLPNTESLGWELTAVTTRIIGARGGYRCPSQSGFLYVVFTDLSFVS